MAEARYETTTRTVEEVSVVLTLTAEETRELRRIVGEAESTPAGLSILSALTFATHVEPDSDMYTHDGVAYQLTARYRDEEGDVWKFRRNPDNPREVQAQTAPVLDGHWDEFTLPTVVRKYGPLCRVG
ncbi:phiSA1p31-related protein [Streptomyces diastaticus]|uniref:phiSA1p31-related protein n=1 Tax=Streptomyces diastaticus TaxID=1956 RepID=UPI0037AC6C41